VAETEPDVAGFGLGVVAAGTAGTGVRSMTGIGVAVAVSTPLRIELIKVGLLIRE
jgi:hypothetical protein